MKCDNCKYLKEDKGELICTLFLKVFSTGIEMENFARGCSVNEKNESLNPNEGRHEPKG